VLANPGGDPMLKLLLIEANDLPTIGAAVAADALDPLVAGSGNPEIEGRNRVRNV
jgi:hypothetical protein